MRAVEFYYILDKTFKPGTDHVMVKRDRDKGKNVRQFYHPDKTRIYIACTVDSRYLKVAIPYRVCPVEWDFNFQKANNSHPNNLKLNSYLSRLKVKANDEYIQMIDKQMQISYDTIKQMLGKLVGKGDTIKYQKNFWDYFDEFLEERAKLKKAETIAKYRSLKASLVKFEKQYYNLSFDKFTMKFYDDFLYYSQEKLKHLNNTISKNLRSLKTFLGWAFEMKYNYLNDFKKFKCTNDHTEPIFLTLEEFRQLEDYIPDTPALEISKDIFIFQCYTGQRISDVSNLQKKDIRYDNAIGYFWELYQLKGAKKYPVKIPILESALSLFNKYANSIQNSDAVFPVQSTQVLNKNLKKIGRAAGIDSEVTKVNFRGSTSVKKAAKKWQFISSHMARKTFVTLALEAGMKDEQIRGVTGHTSVAQMRPYSGVDRVKLKEGMEKVFN